MEGYLKQKSVRMNGLLLEHSETQDGMHAWLKTQVGGRGRQRKGFDYKLHFSKSGSLFVLEICISETFIHSFIMPTKLPQTET